LNSAHSPPAIPATTAVWRPDSLPAVACDDDYAKRCPIAPVPRQPVREARQYVSVVMLAPIALDGSGEGKAGSEDCSDRQL